MSRCFTRPDRSLVSMPRAAAESLCTRNRSGQSISVKNCYIWIPHVAARVPAYNSASPLENEMIPCVVELVSSTDCPSLIPTQALLLRPSKHYQGKRGDTPAGFPVGMTLRECGLCTRCRTARRARSSVPHVPWAMFLVRFSTRYCKSGLSVARYPNNTNKTAQPRCLHIVDCFVTVTLSGVFHSRACCTFRSCTAKVAHLKQPVHPQLDLQTT